MRHLREALRAVRPELEARSLRRGTLCAMADTKKLSNAELRAWSRHSTDKALWRYLGYERTPPAEHRAMQDLAVEGLRPAGPDGYYNVDNDDDDGVTGGGTDGVSTSFEGLLTKNKDNEPIYVHTRAPKPRRAPDGDLSEYVLHYDPRSAKPVNMTALKEMALHDVADPAIGDDFLADVRECSNDDGRYSAVPFDQLLETATGVTPTQTGRIFGRCC